MSNDPAMQEFFGTKPEASETMTIKKSLPSELTSLVGMEIFTQRGLADETKFVVDSVGEQEGWYWASATSATGGITQARSLSIAGLRAGMIAMR